MAAHMLLFTSDSEKDNGKRYILKVIHLYKNTFRMKQTFPLVHVLFLY